jgi:pre-mRNA-splicing factor CWC26
MIVDDDAGWGGAANPMDIDEDDAEAIVASDRAFKKRGAAPGGKGGPGAGSGGSGWTTVREPTPPPVADEQLVVVATEEAEQPEWHVGKVQEVIRNVIPRSTRRGRGRG